MLARRTAELEQYRQESGAGGCHSCLNSGRRQLQSAAALAEGVSPYAVLARGYAIFCNPPAVWVNPGARPKNHGARRKGKRRLYGGRSAPTKRADENRMKTPES